MERTLLPVVAPADDDVATGGIVPVQFEITAFKFELDSDAPQAAVFALALRFAVGKRGLDRLDGIPELLRETTEEIDNTGFVDGRMAQKIKVEGFAVCGCGGRSKVRRGIDVGKNKRLSAPSRHTGIDDLDDIVPLAVLGGASVEDFSDSYP